MERRNRVSLYRDELKGFAILWVVFFHAQLVLPSHWDLLRQWGYGGVDIFFFLMGMGLFYSLQKNAEPAGYASRRLWRILPAYLPLLIAWMAIMYPTYGLTTTEALRGIAGNLTMTGYWIQSPHVFNWFANGQFFFLLLAPLCYAVLSKSRKPALTMLILLLLAGAIGAACIGQKQLMGASRLPVFLLGMAFAMPWKFSKHKNAVRLAYVVAFGVGLALLLACTLTYTGLLYDYGMYWYPFALITPGLCVGLSWLWEKTVKTQRGLAPLRLLGQSSFEIYLLNIWTVELLKKYSVESALLWALISLTDLALGMGYHAIVTRLTGALRQKITE